MFQALPYETFLEIFKNLNRSELLKVSEVSKRFYDAATDSSLWKDFDISHRSLDDKIKILQLSRCRKLETLTLTDINGGVNNEILQIMMKIDLEKLQLMRVNFESIDKVLLANVISKRTDVILIAPQNLEQDHVNMIMKMIPGSGVKNLALNHVKFSGVASRTVAKAINSLESFQGASNKFDEMQMIETFEEMSMKTNLKKMLLQTEFLKKVPAKILSKALNKLDKLCITGRKEEILTSEQLKEIFNEMSHQTYLRHLLLLFPDTSQGSINSFPTDVLTKAISKLKVFYAPRLRFSESQIKSVFQRIDSSMTEELDLGSCHEPQFSLVDQKSLISVYFKIKGQYYFKMLMTIKNLEMSIEELHRVQEENDKMEEEEKMLSAEEISMQWRQLAYRAKSLSLNMLAKKRCNLDFIYKCIPRSIENVDRNIHQRINEAIWIIRDIGYIDIDI